jgi:hypothetical protein
VASLNIPNAYHAATVSDFIGEREDSILGTLTRSAGGVDPLQLRAWRDEVSILKTALSGIDGTILLEFIVPRIGSRIDALLVSGPAVFVIEFKVGEQSATTDDYNQVWDYALDLKNFHQGSHAAPIVPILVPTELRFENPFVSDPAHDGVYTPVVCGAQALGREIRRRLERVAGDAIDGEAWARSRYHPTPTIIEAAQALYANHSVEAITRSEAGARNLSVTAHRIEALIDDARRSSRKAIIFVTGVPGAGKTLVGLNVATTKRGEGATHAVFLSGNGPLVAVLREALARDELQRQRAKGRRVRKGDALRPIKLFIQNVHHFRDDGLRDELRPPVDHVVIFDEAQRAWNREMTADFMRRKKGRPGFTQSEPEFLLSYLDRHPDWAVVICLVGGGQEINRGEAGISAWLDAVSTGFKDWRAYISPELTDREYDAGHALEKIGDKAIQDDSLHLSVSLRSFRAEHVSRFVKALLDHDAAGARAIFETIIGRYPIALTRDLEKARAWIRTRARGSERFGLVASSGAMRLKPHAVDVRIDVDPVHYFLGERNDVRSSYYLEDAATEFQVQGLELDWVVVNWDADFRYASGGWLHHTFHGRQWKNVKNPDRQSYLKNAYRVLLTRARQGMVIFVPPGSPSDPTRDPAFYDTTAKYLEGLGIPLV